MAMSLVGFDMVVGILTVTVDLIILICARIFLGCTVSLYLLLLSVLLPRLNDLRNEYISSRVVNGD